MTARPTKALPSIAPAEMAFLVSRTGLTLNAGQIADLVLAWRQVSALSATIPRHATPADDFAFAFCLPPPGVMPKTSGKAKKAKPSQSKP